MIQESPQVQKRGSKRQDNLRDHLWTNRVTVVSEVTQILNAIEKGDQQACLANDGGSEDSEHLQMAELVECGGTFRGLLDGRPGRARLLCRQLRQTDCRDFPKNHLVSLKQASLCSIVQILAFRCPFRLDEAHQELTFIYPDRSVRRGTSICRMTNPCRFATLCGCVAGTNWVSCSVRPCPSRSDSLLRTSSTSSIRSPCVLPGSRPVDSNRCRNENALQPA